MNAEYIITDENYNQILTSAPIIQPLLAINNLDIHDITENKSNNTNIVHYHKSELHAKTFNSYMTTFFTGFKKLIDSCTNKKDTWFFLNADTIGNPFIYNLQLYYYQRDKEITLNFIKMMNEAFDSIENDIDRKNAKILACYALYSSRFFARLRTCDQVRIYWDEKNKQAFLHLIPNEYHPIDLFEHFTTKKVTEEDYTFTTESKKINSRNAHKDMFLYEISFQKTTTPHICLAICGDFWEKSLKAINENKQKFSAKPQALSNTDFSSSRNVQSTSTNEGKHEAAQPNPAQVGLGTRFLQKVKAYAAPIVLGTAAISATIYFFRAYFM
ncbi:hypothetical protein EKK58_02530 [Candidatus Dependentiae bacterium]|nr:MAG: hypothetical protein EKK58_02530 [Candidatus Dependentiae bacterium]